MNWLRNLFKSKAKPAWEFSWNDEFVGLDDFDHIIARAENYWSLKFKRMQARIQEMAAQISGLKVEIDNLIAKYKAAQAALAQEKTAHANDLADLSAKLAAADADKAAALAAKEKEMQAALDANAAENQALQAELDALKQQIANVDEGGGFGASTN